MTHYFGGANQYNNQYGNQYRRQPMAQKMVRKDHKKEATQIAYYISIDMELQEGTTISDEDKKNIKCRIKWNVVRKAYAEFTGKPYTIAPLYHNKTNKVRNTPTNTTAKANTNYTRTQKHINDNSSHNKRYTRKKLT
jgi:hypothetical protein